MKSLKMFALIVVILVSIGFMLPQRDFSKVEIKKIKVTENIYMLKGSGGNLGVCFGKDGVLMIDDQFAPLADKIKKAIEELSPTGLKYLLNTHLHGDHTGGNAIFGKIMTIVAHENVRKRLAAANPPKAKEALPVITFSDAISIYFNDEEIKVMHYPNGHTDGDAVVYFKNSKVVHMGDNFFAGRFPYVDLKNGGNAVGLKKNIENIVAELPADVKIIPGHGDLSELKDLQTYLAMLKETIQVVASAKEGGKDLATIKASGLPARWKSWGSGFISEERWISIIYNSL